MNVMMIMMMTIKAEDGEEDATRDDVKSVASKRKRVAIYKKTTNFKLLHTLTKGTIYWLFCKVKSSFLGCVLAG